MSDRAAFIRAIVESPDDDTPRLVFADWLEETGGEHDQARAEFIRVQCQAARLADDDPERMSLQQEAMDLLRRHGRFFGPDPSMGADWWLDQCDDPGERPFGTVAWHRSFPPTWHRGFPRWVEYELGTFLPKMRDLLTRDAVFDVRLVFYPPYDESFSGPNWLTELRDSPGLGLVGIFDLCGTYFCDEPDRFVQLVRSPHLTRLKHLAVYEDPIGLAGVRALVESPAPFRLQSLSLGSIINPAFAEIGRAEDFIAAVQLIAQSPRMASLEHLNIDTDHDAQGHGETIAAELIASPYLSSSLSLQFNSDSQAGRLREQLAERFRLAETDDRFHS